MVVDDSAEAALLRHQAAVRRADVTGFAYRTRLQRSLKGWISATFSPGCLLWTKRRPIGGGLSGPGFGLRTQAVGETGIGGLCDRNYARRTGWQKRGAAGRLEKVKLRAVNDFVVHGGDAAISSVTRDNRASSTRSGWVESRLKRGTQGTRPTLEASKSARCGSSMAPVVPKSVTRTGKIRGVVWCLAEGRNATGQPSPSTEDAQRPHVVPIHLRGPDLRTRSIHAQFDPPDRGTEHLAKHHSPSAVDRCPFAKTTPIKPEVLFEADNML